MTLLVIADDEFVAGRIAQVRADLLLSLGDMPEAIILDLAERCRCAAILAVKGNHDTNAPFREPIRDLHLNTFVFRGVAFGGFRGSWKYKPKGHHLFEHQEVDRLMADFPRVDVFLAHNSPRLIHDRDDEVHIGFPAFNNYIHRARPKLFLHGHQHEDVDTMAGTTRVIGVFGHRFLVVPD